MRVAANTAALLGGAHLSQIVRQTRIYLVDAPEASGATDQEAGDVTGFSTARAPDFERVPGLFRRWEIVQLLEPGEIYRIEDAGTTSDGSPLFALYRGTSADAVEGVVQ